MDANSKARMWEGQKEDRRGKRVKELIEDQKLMLLNDGREPTFKGPRGTSYIDLSLAGEKVNNMVTEWWVDPTESLADHKFIIWKKQEIIMIKKPGKTEMDNIKSYRPISLLPILGKILDGILTNRIDYHYHSTKRNKQEQYGFSKQKNTTDAINTLVEKIKDTKKGKKYATLIMMDIEAASDRANREKIVENMKRDRVPTKLINIMIDYFTDRTATLEANNHKMQKTTQQGCPQGSRSGPLLWKILFNDILDLNIEDTNIMTFADDTVLYITSNTYKGVKKSTEAAIERVTK